VIDLGVLLALLSYAAVVIVWPVSIGAVSLMAERSYGSYLGRSLWIAFAILQTAVSIIALTSIRLEF
jgi:hypothetical protein